MDHKIRPLLGAGLLLLAAGMAGAADMAPVGVNLLKEPLEIRNPQTTTQKDGVYTVVNPDEKSFSYVTQTVALNQETALPLTFGADGKKEDYNGPYSGYYGIRLDLVHMDGTKQGWVNTGFFVNTTDWKKAQRTYQPAKPVKTATFYLQFIKNKGKVHFRNPFLIQNKIPAKTSPGNAPAKKKPDFGRLKIGKRDLHLDTVLIRDGAPGAAIVVPAGRFQRGLAAKINAVLKAEYGTELPVVSDKELRSARRLSQNCIIIGNRDRNESAANLYNLHYTLQDAKYPGKGGSELRSLHDPFGDGHNIILAGGSDEEGDAAAVEKLLNAIRKAPRGKTLKLGFLADVTLSPEYKIARDVKDIPLWEESPGYGNQGYFGWNSLSKNLAMLYITNDRYYADEFLRLAFPRDRATVDELVKRDGESYMNDPWKPLRSVYHYRGVMVPLYWDLVEENPVWSEEDRRKVAEELYLRMVDSLTRKDYTNIRRNYDKPGLYRLDRHMTWEAVGAYAIARYFDKHYPSCDSRETLRLVHNALDGAMRHVMYGTVSRFWLQTQLEPFVFYAVLDGGLRNIGNPILRKYAESWLVLPDCSGKQNEKIISDRMMTYSSLFMMQQFGYLVQDDAFTILAKQVSVPERGFRLGQSFYPEKSYGRNFFQESAGKWSLMRTDPAGVNPAPASFPADEVISAMSYRESADASGNFLLLDTSYGLGLREVPRSHSLFNLRIDGVPLLRGHGNTLRFYADGCGKGAPCYYAHVTSYGVKGPFVYADAEMKGVDGFDWRRTVILRRDRYLLIVDDVTPLSDLKYGEIFNDFLGTRQKNTWGKALTGEFILRTTGIQPQREYLLSSSAPGEGMLEPASWDTYHAGTETARFLQEYKEMKKGSRIRFATLLRPGSPAATPSTAQSGNLVALLLPEPASLELRNDGFLFRSSDGALCRKGMQWTLDSGSGDADTQKIKKLLASRSLPAKKDELKEPFPAPLWEINTGNMVQQILPFHSGKQNLLAVASGRKLYFMDCRGAILKKIDAPSEIGALAWQASAQRLLAGCKDESLTAYDLNGRKLWSFTSEMAPELLKFGPYWHKSAIPGIRSIRIAELTPGRERIFIGSTGTLEILNRDGKLEKRLYIQYGPVDNITVLPEEHAETASLLLIRSTGGWPFVHAVSPDLKVTSMGMTHDAAGAGMGSFGFSSVGKTILFPVRFTKDGPVRLIGDFSGAHNRVMVWDRNGKALADANLGIDKAGSAVAPYGAVSSLERPVKFIGVDDYDGDGTKEIAAVTRRKRLFFWTPDMKLKQMLVLDEMPLTATSSHGKVFIGFADGRIYRADGKGALSPVGRLNGGIRVLTVDSDLLIAGSEKGDLGTFRIQ